MTWPLRGVVKGGPDRWSAVYTASGLPCWTNDGSAPGVAPVAAGKTRVLILGIGESGMVGLGNVADALPAGYPRPDGSLWVYDSTRGWTAGVEPSYGPPGAPGIGGAPGVGAGPLFCWRLQAALGSAYEVGFVAAGYSGSSSEDWAVGGTLYNAAKAAAFGALAEPRCVLGAIIHEQGINDVYAGLTGWAAKWSAIETQLRADLGASTQPLYFVRQHNAVPGSGGGINPTSWAALLAAQDGWVSANRFKVSKPEGPWVDAQTHLATAAQVVLSQNYMAAWTANPGVTS